MAASSTYSIVEYFGGEDGYKCGYCKNENGNFSHEGAVVREKSSYCSKKEKLPSGGLKEELLSKPPVRRRLPPPQPQPPPLGNSLAPVEQSPSPLLPDTRPWCLDLPLLGLGSKLQHQQARLFTQNPVSHPLLNQMSLHCCRGSYLCWQLQLPGHQHVLWLPCPCRSGSLSPCLGPFGGGTGDNNDQPADPPISRGTSCRYRTDWWYRSEGEDMSQGAL
ncbi:UNVERIFIED_CONTAM: hypothetical protein FKN15_022742 [Acipenser sinensis]